MSLTVRSCQAFGLPDADKRASSGGSDPYVDFDLLTADGRLIGSACTRTVQNTSDPVFPCSPPPTIELAERLTGMLLRVTVVDNDVKKEDDPLGTITVDVEPGQQSFDRLNVEGVGNSYVFQLSFVCDTVLPMPTKAPGRKKPKAEPPLKFDNKQKVFAVIGPAARVVRGAQGRTYWNALALPPRAPGSRRTAKFVFDKWAEGAPAGAVGMLPPSPTEAQLQDSLGWQSQSVALWLDGTLRQNGARLDDEVSPTDINNGQDTLVCVHVGTQLSVHRDGDLLHTFYNVPSNWCFAVGGFGGKVRLMREADDVGGVIPRAAFHSMVVHNLPDADMQKGGGGSDAYMHFELLHEDGTPMTFPDGEPREAQTETVENAEPGVVLPGPIAVMVPPNFTTGLLQITLYDNDPGKDDDALGQTTMPLNFSAEGEIVFDHVTLAGQAQPGAAGYLFPDSDFSFKVEFKGHFA